MSDGSKTHQLNATAADRLALDLDELERQLRQLSAKPAAAPSPAQAQDDPLAELARLVGRDDPIRSMLAGQTRQAPPPAAAPAYEPAAPAYAQPAYPEPVHAPETAAPQLRGGFDPSAMPEPAQPAYAEPAWHDTRADVHEAHPQSPRDDWQEPAPEAYPYREEQAQAYAPEAYAPQADARYAPHGYAPGEEAAYGQGEEDLVPLDKARSRKGLITVAALMLTATAGVAGVLMLRDKSPSAPTGQAPVITADKGPMRVAPQNPGGVEIPNQNKQIYERGAAVQDNTKVVSREEQPIDVRQTARAMAQRDSIEGLIGDSGSRRAGATQPANPAQGNPLAALGEPKRVRTVAVRPDGTVIGDQTVAPTPAAMQLPAGAQPSPIATGTAPTPVRPQTPAAAPQLPPQAQPAPQPVANPPAQPVVPAAPAARVAAPAGEPLSITPGGQKIQQRVANAGPAVPPVAMQLPSPAQPAATPQRPVAVAAAPAQPVAAPSGTGDFMVQLAARPSEREALDAFSQLQRRYPDLGGLSPVVRRAEVGDKTIYRLRVGSMSREEANSLCEKLKTSGGQCFVARN